VAAKAAPTFETAAREIKSLDAERKAAKATILDWLDGKPSRELPDGCIVTQVTVEYGEADIHRAAYSATTVTIQHPLPPR